MFFQPPISQEASKWDSWNSSLMIKIQCFLEKRINEQERWWKNIKSQLKEGVDDSGIVIAKYLDRENRESYLSFFNLKEIINQPLVQIRLKDGDRLAFKDYHNLND